MRNFVKGRDDKATDEIVFLSALCMMLSALEFAIPKPLPFLRLGLANVPVVLALRKFPARQVLLLVALKVLGQQLVSGTLFSYVALFSVAGSFASIAIMLPLSRLGGRHVSDFGVCLFGSLANNAAQVLCARLVMFGQSAYLVAPLLFACGSVTGALLGLFCVSFKKRSRWYALLGTGRLGNAGGQGTDVSEGRDWTAYACFFVALALMAAFLFVRVAWVQWCLVALFYVLASARRKKPVRLLPSFFVTLSVTLLALLSPSGTVLLYVGRWRITRGALEQGLSRAARLVGMVFLSQFAVSRSLALPGRAGALVSGMFRVFDALNGSRPRLSSGAKGRGTDPVMRALDEWLLSFYGEPPVEPEVTDD